METKAKGKDRTPVYCEIAFLKKFAENNPSIMPIDDVKVWLGLYDILNRCSMQIDVKTESYFDEMQKGPLMLQQLWKRHANGDSELQFSENHKCDNYIEKLMVCKDARTIYLLDKEGKKCIDYGAIAISADNLKQQAHLFKDNGCAIEKDYHGNWKKILTKEYDLTRCNSMIVVDNYIFKNPENLFSLLDGLLPYKLKCVFHLSIFTESINDANKKYHQLKSQIERLRPELKVQLSLYVSNGKSAFHDRAILTNNTWISCDGGFDLFNERGKAMKSTKISIIYPHIQSAIDWSLPAYNNLIRQTREVKQKFESEKGYGEVFPKDSPLEENRLYMI